MGENSQKGWYEILKLNKLLLFIIKDNYHEGHTVFFYYLLLFL